MRPQPWLGERLVLRADASRHIGVGHVMRMLALAEAWETGGGTAVLAAATLPTPLRDRLRDEGREVARINARPGSIRDALAVLQALGPSGPRYVVLDGYRFGGAYQERLRRAGARVVCVDDFGQLDRYAADVVVDQNLGAREAMYAGRAPGALLLIGPSYALLRAEVLAARDGARGQHAVPVILVTLGGADAANVTALVLEALALLSPRVALEATTVLGPANEHVAMLRELAARLPLRVELLVHPEHVARTMAAADLAVTAAGSTCWELAYLGVPMLTIAVTDHQRAIATGLAEAGAAVDLGWRGDLQPQPVAERVAAVLEDGALRCRLRDRGRELVDGHGAERVLRAMVGGVREECGSACV